jgi:VWFA-related protein
MKGEMLANEQKVEGRTKQTLRSLEDLGDHLAGIPGRKSLVWISGGISMLTVSPHGGVKSYENLVRDTSRRLAQQGITLYMVDSRGLRPYAAAAPLGPRRAPRGSGQEDPFERFRRDSEISNDPLSAMYKIANVTGGRVFWDTNDMAKGMKAVASDSMGTYSLGFYADAETGDTWRDLNVDVKRKGVKVLHRSGYLPETVQDTPVFSATIESQLSLINFDGTEFLIRRTFLFNKLNHMVWNILISKYKNLCQKIYF